MRGYYKMKKEEGKRRFWKMCDILIVEDSKDMIRKIKNILRKEREYTLYFCKNKEELEQQISERQFELILIDSNLCMINVLDFLQYMQKSNELILLLTQKNQIEFRIRGFQLGVADCAILSSESGEMEEMEFQLRVQAIVQRAKVKNIWQYDDLLINTEKHQVLKKDCVMKLNQKSLKFCYIL